MRRLDGETAARLAGWATPVSYCIKRLSSREACRRKELSSVRP